MNDDTQGTSADDAPRDPRGSDNSAHDLQLGGPHRIERTRHYVSVPQLMHEMLRDGEQHRQQERDLIELEIQDLKRIKVQFLIDLILATCEREKITLKEVLHELESPRIEE